MTDSVALANLAVSKVGSSVTLTSLDDDRPVARAIKRVWEQSRRAAIRDHPWNFATRRGNLAAQVTTREIYPWQNAFPLPSDSLRLIEVLNMTEREDYALEGKEILCNSSGPLYVKYLIDVPESALWEELFGEVFACRLAMAIGKSIAGSSYSMSDGEMQLKNAKNAAKRVDARENPPVRFEDSEWVTVRLGSGYDYASGDWEARSW